MRAAFPLYFPVLLWSFILAATDAIQLEPNVLNLIGNGVTVAVLAYYVIYDIRVRTPKQQKAAEESLEKSRKLFSDEMANNRELFLKEQAANRVLWASEQGAMRDFYHREIGVYRGMLIANMEAMRTAVHDVRDVAHETVMKVAEQVQSGNKGNP
jgi:hypothetical protein